MMKLKLIKNIKALSKFPTIILLITSLIIGALLSYLWVMGYYVTLGLKVPENPTLSISDVAFTNQNTGYFNVTFFNPSFSPDASITEIAVKTADDKVHKVNQIVPQLSQETSYIPRGENKTFQCMWNWAEYTGQTIGVIAFVDEGSGPTCEVETPFVGLTITEVHFNSSISVTQFNLTIQNSQNSATYLNISKIVPTGALQLTQVSPSLPYKLDTSQNVTFICAWDWTNYQNKSITMAVHTEQGYVAYYNMTTPPLGVEVTNTVFSEPETTHFDVTVRNRNESSAFVDINKITVTLENGTVNEINGTLVDPPLPYKLNQNSTITFKCPWDWARYRGKSVTVSIFTVQNYTVHYIKATPSPIEITDAIFDPANTTIFSLIAHNSALYYTYVNITNVTVTFEDGTETQINGTLITPDPLPYLLDQNSTKTFTCPWNWTNYQGRNITITVTTAENGVAQFVKATPKRVILTITAISFDSVNPSIFSVTVRNSALSLEDANITRITVTLENGTVKEISSVMPSLPYLLSPNSTAIFTCQWDWTNYRGKNITITVDAGAEKGYTASSLYTVPPLQ
jgi:hypothetical protein